jgi:hypothetical protein
MRCAPLPVDAFELWLKQLISQYSLDILPYCEDVLVHTGMHVSAESVRIHFNLLEHCHGNKLVSVLEHPSLGLTDSRFDMHCYQSPRVVTNKMIQDKQYQSVVS